MVTLKEAIKSIKNPKPVDFDPEDFERKNPDSDVSDNEDATEFEKKEREQEKALARAHYVDVGKSKLRQKNDSGIKINGARYTGSKVSRKSLYEKDEDSDEEEGHDEDDDEEEEDNDDDEEEEEASDGEEQVDSENDIMDVDSDDQEQDDSESEDDDDDEEAALKSSELNEEKRSQLKNLLVSEQQKLVSQISKAAKAEAQKGEGIKNQINIYEAILDTRVNIQKGLAASNTLPLSQATVEKHSTENTSKLLKKVTQNIFELLDQIAQVRKQMMIKDNLIKGNKNDNEDEDEDEEEDSNKDTVELKTGKRSLAVAFGNEQALSKRLKPYRDAVLTKWSKKVQAASGISALNASKFSIQNTNAQTQVASQLADMDRLIKRTQINRSEAKVLGSDDKSNDKNENKEGGDDEEEEDEEDMDEKTRIKKRIEKQKLQKKLKQQQILQEKKQKKAAAQQQSEEPSQFVDPDSSLKEKPEIFDDLDFYKALLKDLVDRRMADSSVASSVTWTISKRSEKDKSRAEDKFSKERRLNFKVQEKLQNFDAPRNIVEWTDDQIDELFSGLFGQKIIFSEDEKDGSDEDDEESEKEDEDDYIVNDGLKIFG